MSYSSSHPWYYVLGGRVLFPSEIRASVDLGSYPILMIEDVSKVAKMQEPKRSERLREIRLSIRRNLRHDLKRYLEVVRGLKELRRESDPKAEPAFNEIHQSVSLKHNHIYYRYAQLMICEDHLAQQADLFESL